MGVAGGSLFDQFVRLQRNERVLSSELHDTIVVTDLGDFPAHEPVAEAAELVAIQVVDEVVHELRRRGGRGLRAVTGELLEYFGLVTIGHWRVVVHAGDAMYIRASSISGGDAARASHHSSRRWYSAHAVRPSCSRAAARPRPKVIRLVRPTCSIARSYARRASSNRWTCSQRSPASSS